DEALDLLLEGSGLTSGLSEKGVLVISLEESNVPVNNESKTGGDRMNSQTVRKSIFTGIATFLASIITAPGAGAQTGDDVRHTESVLEEIVVTAQKREQSIQDVGIAITAFTGEDIRRLGYETSSDIARMTPGLHVAHNSGSQKQLF